MNRRVELHPAARDDIRKAVEWYEAQASGLGRLVPMELRRVIERLKLFPDAYPQLKPGVRQAVLSRMPYYAIYTASDDHITLIALLHVSRDPHIVDEALAGRTRRQ